MTWHEPATVRRCRRTERGIFTFAEILLATLILALSATATAYWMETVANLTADAEEQTIGTGLVKNVESVVSAKKFREPGSTAIGPESGETLLTYDDIDDYHGLVSTPPFGPDSTPLQDYTEWTVRVTVAAWEPSGTESGSGPQAAPAGDGDAEVRQITIVVEHRSREVSRTSWLRVRSPFE